MLKHLPVFIVCISFFTAVNAQTSADSVAKHPATDTTIKQPPVDSVTKHSRVKNPTKHTPVVIAVKHSPVKTLTDKQYSAYLNGSDMDEMALPAELNHYPLPDKVLKFKKELSLSPIQVSNVNKIALELHRKKAEMGAYIIRNEKMLDSLFHNKQMEEGEIIFYSNRSGLYTGELRNAILQACYSTEKILSDDQIRKLEALEKGN